MTEQPVEITILDFVYSFTGGHEVSPTREEFLAQLDRIASSPVNDTRAAIDTLTGTVIRLAQYLGDPEVWVLVDRIWPKAGRYRLPHPEEQT